MNPARPTPVLVMAILNFVIGGLSLLYHLCCTLGGLVMFGAMSGAMKNMPAPPTTPGKLAPPNPFTAMGSMPDYIPNFYAMSITTAVVGSLMAGMLIAAGIGLLNMREWARRTCIAYGGLSIFISLASFAYALIVVLPATERWQRDFYAQMNMPAPPSSPLANSMGAIFGLLFGIAYAIALLVVMFLPSVRAAFAGPPLPTGPHDFDDRR